MTTIENTPYDELEIGTEASLTRTLTEDDIKLFAALSGDLNPAHMDPEFARDSRFHEVIGHGMWSASLISTVLGMKMPGPGTIYVGQTLEFTAPVRVGDIVEVKLTVREKAEHRRVLIDCNCTNENGEVVLTGTATVIAPKDKIVREAKTLPHAVLYEEGTRLHTLIEKAKGTVPMPTGVVHPVDANSLHGAIDAAKAGLIVPVLIGPSDKIAAAAEAIDADISSYEIVHTPHSHAAAEKAVAMAAAGEIGALMKGALHTDELMGAVVARKGGLRTERRISHVYVMDTPSYDKFLLISDAAINVAPTLEEKRDIVRNAIDLAHAIGVPDPKVAILSAVETVYPTIPSTLDAAALCKMADRGQITGGRVDGPLAFDNAVSMDAVKAKGIISPVAGQADILIVPSLEAGNMIAKQLDYLAGAVAAGVVIGARVPIILTSRAEGALARLAASAVAALYHEANPPTPAPETESA